MDMCIAYFDEAGDDGVTTASSEFFVLTSLYMNADRWQENFDKIRSCRQRLKEQFGFHSAEELHTKHLLSDKDPYRKYGWTSEQKQEIVKEVARCIADLDAKIVNVIIDKTYFVDENYHVLENALKYNIQRIENDSAGKWHYMIITDKGRLAPMRRTARAVRAFNPIQSKYSSGYINQPVRYLIEDILEKDSEESYFIQVCDFVSYFVHLYYKTREKKQALPNRVGRVIDEAFIGGIMETLRKNGVLNLNASQANPYGLVVYPKPR